MIDCEVQILDLMIRLFRYHSFSYTCLHIFNDHLYTWIDVYHENLLQDHFLNLNSEHVAPSNLLAFLVRDYLVNN
jgi:hypothetical protein